jgi:hypothetical protein
MNRSRWALAGPQIASCGFDFGAGGLGELILGVRKRRRWATSFAGGCQRALRFGVGVVDPGAKRRIWD